MPKTKYISSDQARVKTEAVVPGRIILTFDGRMYWDSPEGTRVEIVDIIELDSEAARIAIASPLEKFYYVTGSDKLYRYHGGTWRCVNPDYEFIGSDGKILIQYLPTNVVSLGTDNLVPSSCLPVATSGAMGIALLGSTDGAARYGYAVDVGLGNVTNDAQVKASDVVTVEPSATSTDAQVVSAKRLWTIIGAALSTLRTSSKTIVGSINEIFSNFQSNIEASTAAHLVTHSGTVGTFGTPKAISDFIQSPAAQTVNTQVLIAPATKGGVPTLKPLSDFVQTGGNSDITPYASSTTPKAHGTAQVGSEVTYSRGDHVHPSDAPVFESNTGNIKMNGSVNVGQLETVARADHVHPVDSTRASTSVATTSSNGLMAGSDKSKLDAITAGATVNNPYTGIPSDLGTASAGSATNYARGDHVHKNPYTITLSGTTLTITIN